MFRAKSKNYFATIVEIWVSSGDVLRRKLKVFEIFLKSKMILKKTCKTKFLKVGIVLQFLFFMKKSQIKNIW